MSTMPMMPMPMGQPMVQMDMRMELEPEPVNIVIKSDTGDQIDEHRMLVKESRKLAADARYSLDEKRLRWWKNYNSRTDRIRRGDTGEELVTLSNLFMPWTYGFVEQRVPRIIGRIPMFEVTGQDFELDPEMAEVYQTMLRKDLERAGYLKSALIHVKQAEIFGLSVRTNYWRLEHGKVQKREKEIEPMSGAVIGMKNVLKDTLIYDCPWTEVCDIWRCYFQPGALSIDQSDWFIYETILSRAQIWKMVKTGVFDRARVLELFEKSSGIQPFVNSSDSTNPMSDSPFWKKMEVLGLSPQSNMMGARDRYPRHRITTMWMDDKIITLADDFYVLRRGLPNDPGRDDNPYGRKPFREFKSVPVPFMLEGKGVAEVMEELQKAINVQENQRIDNINLAINKVAMGPDDACDWDSMIMAPGQRVRSDNPDAVRFLEVPPVGSDSYMESEKLIQAAQWATAINDYLAPGSGGNTKMTKTARGIQTATEQSNLIFSMISELFDIQDVQTIGQDFWNMRQRFQDRLQVVRICNEKGFKYVNVAPEDLMITPDIKAIGGSAQPQDKAEEQAKANLVFQSVFGNPIAQQLGVDQKKVLINFFRANGVNDPNTLFTSEAPSDDPVQAVQKEHDLMSFGQPVPASGDDVLHLQLHMLFVQSPFFVKVPEKYRMIFKDHVLAHLAKKDKDPTSPWFQRNNYDDAVTASSTGSGFGG